MKPAVRNIAAVASGDAFIRAIGFLVTVYLARTLGPSSFGVISTGLAVFAYLDHLSGAGIRLLETRNAAAEKEVDEGRVNTIVSLRLALGTGVVLATVAVSALAVQAEASRDVIGLYSLMVIPLAFSLEWFFQGRERFQLITVSRILTYVVYGCFVFLFVKTGGDLRLVPIGFLAGTLVSSLFLLRTFRSDHAPIRFSVDIPAWKAILSRSFFPGVALLVAQSAVNLGPIVLSLWFTSADAGMYSSAMKLVFVLLLIDRVLNSLFLPLISRIRMQRPEETGTIVNVTTKVAFLTALPLGIGCFLAAPSLLTLIFGQGYEGSVPFLRWLIPYFVLTLPNSVFICALLADGKEKIYTKTLMTGSSLLTLFVCLLPALFGPAGVAIGVSLGELVMFVMFLAEARKIVRIDFLALCARSIPAIVAMFVTIEVLQGLTIFVSFPAGVVVFVILSLAFGGLSRSEVLYLGNRIV